MKRKDKRREIRRQAKAWMVLNNIRNVDIKKALAMNNHTIVIETLAGKRNDRRVLQFLLAKGCPVSYLAIPQNMVEAE